MVDTHSYTEALLTLSDIMPNEILIHEGSTKSLHSSALTTNIYKLVNRFDNTVSSHQVVPISGQVCHWCMYTQQEMFICHSYTLYITYICKNVVF